MLCNFWWKIKLNLGSVPKLKFNDGSGYLHVYTLGSGWIRIHSIAIQAYQFSDNGEFVPLQGNRNRIWTHSGISFFATRNTWAPAVASQTTLFKTKTTRQRKKLSEGTHARDFTVHFSFWHRSIID